MANAVNIKQVAMTAALVFGSFMVNSNCFAQTGNTGNQPTNAPTATTAAGNTGPKTANDCSGHNGCGGVIGSTPATAAAPQNTLSVGGVSSKIENAFTDPAASDKGAQAKPAPNSTY